MDIYLEIKYSHLFSLQDMVKLIGFHITWLKHMNQYILIYNTVQLFQIAMFHLN